MLGSQDSEALTRVGPGTVMGDLMRQYWLPAAMSSELKADGAPMRLLLLGEKLIAFRDSKGKVGVLDHRCPHRCASLFLGRNEESGLRCTYHGWKFAVDGTCVDMPSVPPHQDFKDRVKAKAYRVHEQNGLIWVYMGDRAEAPPLPGIEAALLPEAELNIFLVQRECNWLQALEGDIDTSHFGFLHAGSLQPEDLAPENTMHWQVANRAPEYHVAETDWGVMYAAYRQGLPGKTYWRFANFLFPFWTQPPQGRFVDRVNSRAWVPMDDTHTMFVSLTWKKQPPSIQPMKDGRMMPGMTLGNDYLPNTTDWHGRWRLAANPSNDWQIDRDSMDKVYTGIAGVHLQDQAITESMGPITDHEWEHLGPGDMMITRTRRRLLAAAQALREKGELPPGVADPEVFMGARSGDVHLPTGMDWREAYAAQVREAVRPLARAAE